MVKDSAFENNPVLQALRDEPRKINGGVDTDRGENYPGINCRAKLGFGKRAELVNRCEYGYVSSFEPAI